MHAEESLEISGHRMLHVVRAGGSQSQPILRLPGILVRGGATVILKGLTLEFKPSKTGRRKPLLYVQGTSSVVLEDCRLHGTGIRIRGEGSVQLTRTLIEDSMGMPGIDGKDFLNLTLKECTVRSSDSDGIRIGSRAGTCAMEDCRIIDNAVHGCVAAGNLTAAMWQITRCTFSNNRQCGFWVDTDACITWGSNSFSDNLQETGGKGTLLGYMPGHFFSKGDACKVWLDEHREWLPGVVRELKQGHKIVVEVQDPNGKSTEQLTKEARVMAPYITFQVDKHQVQQPKSGLYQPPPWATVANEAKDKSDRERQRKDGAQQATVEQRAEEEKAEEVTKTAAREKVAADNNVQQATIEQRAEEKKAEGVRKTTLREKVRANNDEQQAKIEHRAEQEKAEKVTKTLIREKVAADNDVQKATEERRAEREKAEGVRKTAAREKVLANNDAQQAKIEHRAEQEKSEEVTKTPIREKVSADNNVQLATAQQRAEQEKAEGLRTTLIREKVANYNDAQKAKAEQEAEQEKPAEVTKAAVRDRQQRLYNFKQIDGAVENALAARHAEEEAMQRAFDVIHRAQIERRAAERAERAAAEAVQASDIEMPLQAEKRAREAADQALVESFFADIARSDPYKAEQNKLKRKEESAGAMLPGTKRRSAVSSHVPLNKIAT